MEKVNKARYIIDTLEKRKQTVTFAESCTGGLIASFLTKESGSSAVFNGSVISYSNEIKEKWLNVKEENLIKYGAVSKEVVSDMLDGSIALSDADYAIAVSGVAGPTGGTEEKPVGTVIIGVKYKNSQSIIEKHLFDGDRASVQENAKIRAINMLISEIDKN